MIRGGKILLVSCSLAAAGCAAQDVKVRAIADPAAKFRYGGDLLAQGRAQLAFGNAGLALETFRKLQREQPESADAFAGIAACYAAMSRYDLARANYEFALAYAPGDPRLLLALANSLDRLGESEQAGEVRAEAARLAAPIVHAPPTQVAATSLAVPRLSSVTVKLPAPSEAPAKTKEEAVAIAKPQLTKAAVSLTATRAAVLKQSTPISSAEIVIDARDEGRPAPAAMKEEEVAIEKPQLTAAGISLPAAQPALLERVALAANVGIAIEDLSEMGAPAAKPMEEAIIAKPRLAPVEVGMPIARPALLDKPAFKAAQISIPRLIGTQPVAAAVDPARPAPVPADKPREISPPQVAVQTEMAPHMERLSTGEVALITKPQPVWLAQSAPRKSRPEPGSQTARAVAILNRAQAQAEARAAPVATVHWVPLRYASAPVNVEILNAARSEGLAARSRVALLNRGWRKIGIGNAQTVRARSVVLYSPSRATIARSLAAHFGCKAIKVQGVQNVVVLLGRDAAFPRPAASRG